MWELFHWVKVTLMSDKKKKTGPFNSLREFMDAIEASGRLLRIKEIDQDQYEYTALMYKLIDEFGFLGAPAVLAERVKINGKWVEGPVIANQYGAADIEALAVGVNLSDIGEDQVSNYKEALKKMTALCPIEGIKPKEIPTEAAPCKEVILRGDEIDLENFPFLQTNPADNGQFINTGNLVTIDSENGRNVGTYRMQIKGPRKIAVNAGKGQHGEVSLSGRAKRGEKIAKAAVIYGADPFVFAMSSSKTARLEQDELEIAGGYLGRPVEVVKCEDSDILVPANVEMIIEGEIPLDDMEPEGPFGEFFGYMGEAMAEQYYMNIKTITHRKNPIFVNSFTGVSRGFITSPGEANSNFNMRKLIPNLVGIHLPSDMVGFFFMSIDKQRPGEAIEHAEKFAQFLGIAKVLVIVDKDVNIHNSLEVIRAIAARWQPGTASKILKNAVGLSTDPSSMGDPDITGYNSHLSSKIIVDATRQWPEEGGPESFAPMNKDCLLDSFPDALNVVEKKWGHMITAQRKKYND